MKKDDKVTDATFSELKEMIQSVQTDLENAIVILREGLSTTSGILSREKIKEALNILE